jgi:hypothetical protein
MYIPYLYFKLKNIIFKIKSIILMYFIFNLKNYQLCSMIYWLGSKSKDLFKIMIVVVI